MSNLLRKGVELRVITGENLSEDYHQYPLASFKQRAFAVLLDGFFSALMMGVLSGVLKHVLDHPGRPGGVGPRLLQISFVFAYYYFPLYASGETLGKKLVGVKVVSENGDGKLGFGQVLGREAIGKLISMLALGLGYVGAITRKDKKTFHDRLFSTRVVTFR